MKRVFSSFNYILIIGIGSFFCPNLQVYAAAIARREVVNEARPVVESVMHRLPKQPFHFMKPAEQSRLPELRTHVSQDSINAAARVDHVPSLRPEVPYHQPLWRPSSDMHHSSMQPISQAAVWRAQLPRDQQELIEKIYDQMGDRGQDMFNTMSPEQQIDFMQSQLKAAADHAPSTEVSSTVFRPAAKTTGKGMLSAARGTQSHVFGPGVHGTLVPKSLMLPKVVEDPSQAVVPSDDPFKHLDLSGLDRKTRDFLKGFDLSKVKDLVPTEVVGKKSLVTQKPFVVEKRVAEFKDVLEAQHMPSEIVDVTLDGIKNYLVKSKDSGMLESIAVKKVQDFLDFESEVSDEDYHETREMVVRERELQDVIVPIKEAFIDNFGKVVDGELQEINLRGIPFDNLMSEQQRELLKNTKTFQEFMQQYEGVKRIVVDNLMLRKTSQFLDSMTLDSHEKDLVRSALRTELDSVSGHGVDIVDVWRHLSEYGQRLEQYFVIDPVGKHVDHHIDMNSDLTKVVNQWRINTFEAKVQEHLTKLGAPKKLIDTYLENIRTELVDEGIELTQSPTIVFDHIRTLWTDLLKAQPEDIAGEIARMKAEEARIDREAQEKLRQEAAKKSKPAKPFKSIRKPDEIVPVRSGRRVSPSSDTGALQPNLPRSTVAKRDPVELPTTEPSVKPVRKDIVRLDPRRELSRMPETVTPKRISREDRSNGAKPAQPDLTPKEISAEDAHGAVERITQPRAQMLQLELTARDELMRDEQVAQKELEHQMQKMMEDIYTGQQLQLLTTESGLRDQVGSLQAQGVQKIRDMMIKNTITMREAELMLKQQEDMLTKMMDEMFAKQVELFEAGKARLLTEAQEQRIREAEEKLQQQLREKFELEIQNIEELQESHRSDIVVHHETTLETIHALMVQEHEKALARQKEREQKEEDDKRVKEEQEAAERRAEQAKDQEKVAEEEERARQSAQDAYKSTIDEFSRLRSTLLIMLQQLDQERIKTAQAEEESREALAHAQSTFLLAAQYQAATEILQKQYVQKMQDMLDQESQKILDDIHEQQTKIAREIDQYDAVVAGQHVDIDPFKPRVKQKRSDKKIVHEEPIDDLIMKAGKIQQAQAGSTDNRKKKVASLQEKEEQEEFLHKLEDRIEELVEKVEEELHHSHHGDDEDDDHKRKDRPKGHPHIPGHAKDHEKSKKDDHAPKDHPNVQPQNPSGNSDHKKPKEAKHEPHVPHSHTGDDHESPDHNDHAKGHPHVPGHEDDHKKPKTKEPKDVVPKSIIPEPVESNVEHELAQVGMDIARDMFNAGEERVTPQTIQPWIDNNPEYQKLQEDEKKLNPSHDPKTVQYLAGYTQGCMQIIQRSDDVMQPQMEEVREEGPVIAQELIDKKIDRVSMPQLKEIIQRADEFDLVDTQNPYAMKWSQGYVQGCMELLKEKDQVR